MNSEGIGLGLTIVKSIVESSGGQVSVFSPGIEEGSTFEFNMPMKKIQENSLLQAEEPEEPEDDLFRG